jgi:hypothetical protein
MGPDQSKQGPGAAKAAASKAAGASGRPAAPAPAVPAKPAATEYEGIAVLNPLVGRRQQPEQFPPDIEIPSAGLPASDAAAKAYFQQIGTAVNRSQDQLTQAVKGQLDEYAKLATLLEARRNELDGRLAKMLSLFRQFDAEVKTTVELLGAEVERPQKIAADIDAAIPKYADFS